MERAVVLWLEYGADITGLIESTGPTVIRLCMLLARLSASKGATNRRLVQSMVHPVMTFILLSYTEHTQWVPLIIFKNDSAIYT